LGSEVVVIASGVVTVPLKLTVCWLPVTPPELSVTANVPVRVPVAVGVKVTLMVQLPPAFRLLPQLLIWEREKSPVTDQLVMVRATPPVLPSVTG
jgi:hypothetical protein